MARFVRTFSAVNMLVTLALVVSYLVFGFLSGIAIDQHFLGAVRGHLSRAGGPMMPAWSFPVILDSMIVVFYFCRRLFQWESYPHRIFAGVFGLVFVIGLLMQYMPHRIIFAEEAVVPAKPLHDQILAWYVWCSHLFYALIGSNED